MKYQLIGSELSFGWLNGSLENRIDVHNTWEREKASKKKMKNIENSRLVTAETISSIWMVTAWKLGLQSHATTWFNGVNACMVSTSWTLMNIPDWMRFLYEFFNDRSLFNIEIALIMQLIKLVRKLIWWCCLNTL